MKQSILLLLLASTGIVSAQRIVVSKPKDPTGIIHQQIDSWHKAAAEANFNEYFSFMSEDAIFIGTDASENWSLDSFKVFCKPYFDKGKAWNFTPLERHIYFNKKKNIAWFDELLNTQMKICRGSGVLRFEHGEWKIVHYVLSMTIPNEHSKEVTRLKTPLEDLLIDTLRKKSR